MRKGFLIYEERRKYLVIFEDALVIYDLFILFLISVPNYQVSTSNFQINPKSESDTILDIILPT
jgi:hypothetical protein